MTKGILEEARRKYKNIYCTVSDHIMSCSIRDCFVYEVCSMFGEDPLRFRLKYGNAQDSCRQRLNFCLRKLNKPEVSIENFICRDKCFTCRQIAEHLFKAIEDFTEIETLNIE